MLKEVITFVEKIDENPTVRQIPTDDWRGKKFFILKTKDNDDVLTYDGFELLEDNSKIQMWCDKNKHYTEILEKLNSYILPSDLRKALGSTSGLITFSFFTFKLKEKNFENLETKIKKTKFSDENDDTVKIKKIQDVLISAIPDLQKRSNDSFDHLDFYVIVHTTKERFKIWKEVADHFITNRMSYGKKNQRTDGLCFVCKKEGTLATPIFLTNNNDTKIFLKHVTRNSIDNNGTSLFACEKCVHKSNRFEKFLKDYKIKIFPLFIDPDEISEEIRLLDHDLQKDKNNNKFAFIFDQLHKRQTKGLFDFYLVVLSGKYFFFDYVTGYRWHIGTFENFFKNEKYAVTRQVLEVKIWTTLVDEKFREYFDSKIIDKKVKDNSQKTMVHSIKQKLFDFVYRNQNSLAVNDLRDIVLFRIEREIKNNSVVAEKCKEYLNLFYNKHLLLHTVDDDKNLFKQISDSKKDMLESAFEKFEINDDEVWAYYVGQIAYYLASLSKSENKNFSLLEPFINKSTTELVKRTIVEMSERYKHEISLNNKRFKLVISKILSYEINKSFIELKIPFYVGAFDENVVYANKSKGDE